MHPYGVHWSRERAEGEWTCDQEKKKEKSRPIMGAPQGHPYACPHRGHALMGWVPYPPHMGPHFVGPITPFGLQK